MRWQTKWPKAKYVVVALGWVLDKKCLSIDSGILGAHADIYRRLLVPKTRGLYIIKFWAQQP